MAQRFAWGPAGREEFVAAMVEFERARLVMKDDPYPAVQRDIFASAVKMYHPETVWGGVIGANFQPLDLDQLLDDKRGIAMVQKRVGDDPLIMYGWMDCLWSAYFASGDSRFATRVKMINDATGTAKNSYKSIVNVQGLKPLRDSPPKTMTPIMTTKDEAVSAEKGGNGEGESKQDS